MELQIDSVHLDKSVFTLLGETGDGLVYRCWLMPDEESDPPYSGTLAFRLGYDPDNWGEVTELRRAGMG